MEKEERLDIAKELIEAGRLKTFKDIFLYVSRTNVAKQLGFNYKRFLVLIKNPASFRYTDTIAIAALLKVPPIAISTLIHNQLEAKKPSKAKKT